MNVLFVEDNGNAALMADYLRDSRGYTVRLTDSIINVIYYLDKDPGAHAYDALVFDLNLPPRGLPDELMDEAKDKPVGLVFVKRWIAQRYPEIMNRVIFYSAYFHTLENQGESFDSYLTVDKRDPNVIQKMIDAIETASRNRSI